MDKPTDFWANVIFSDENKYNKCGCDEKQTIQLKPNEEKQPKNLIPTVKHCGGSVMVWGCMSANGVGKLQFLETNMDRYIYFNIMKSSLSKSATKLGFSGNWYLKQDNDPKHTSRILMLFSFLPKNVHFI